MVILPGFVPERILWERVEEEEPWLSGEVMGGGGGAQDDLCTFYIYLKDIPSTVQKQVDFKT